jgi:hypothetical protein
MNDYFYYNAILDKKLQDLTLKDKDYWSFRDKATREHGHGLFQYPAMMVPQVTKTIIDKIIEVHPNIKSIRDPFVGSGTVLTESMLRGLDFSGTDINPMAILLCQVKSGPFFIAELQDKVDVLINRINGDKKTHYAIDFSNKNKWFTRSALINLSKIKRSILLEEELWVRKFFWVALAETIRLTSNSRTSTFKLHIRTYEDIQKRKREIKILDVFFKILRHNLLEYANLHSELDKNGLIKNGYYKEKIDLSFADVKTFTGISKSDVIITSPPYGDNITTVPYGQHSYLPLQWIEFSDIDENLTKQTMLRTTREIDNRSLGGYQDVTNEESTQLFQNSVNLRFFIKRLSKAPKDKEKVAKVVSFFRDIDKCIDPILKNLNTGGIMVWVLGNRMVGKKRVPLDKIVSDLFKNRNVNTFCKLTRKIPSKRMPLKNKTTETMSDEVILLMRKTN